jgi:branched-chain amino acid transport system permease protein
MLYSLFHDTALGGGSDGIYVQVRPELILWGFKPVDLENPTEFYYFVLIMLIAVFSQSSVARAFGPCPGRHQGQ